ncbi:VOC family protein [Ascidiimonas sp. W6]|uniref:VOC family protein n=1 Tax=Ascidiimonas meishanensis TaxID=3128903 RepID=UPI0030ECCA2F
MATIIHFDISADDIQRAKHFYEQLFGWNIEKFPNSAQDYYIIETKTTKGEKGITGGIAKREKAYQKITNFIQVDSIDESIAKVKELGGQIIEPKTAISNVGTISGCKDTEDNILGLIEVEKK